MPEPSETDETIAVRPLTSDEMTALITHLGGVIAMADLVNVAVYPQRMVLLLPHDVMPGMTQFGAYEVIHADVPEPMLGIPQYRVGQ